MGSMRIHLEPRPAYIRGVQSNNSYTVQSHRSRNRAWRPWVPSLTPSGSASTQLAGCTLSSSFVLCSSIGDTPISTRVPIMSASRETTPSRSPCVSGSPPEVVGKRRVARRVQESCSEPYRRVEGGMTLKYCSLRFAVEHDHTLTMHRSTKTRYVPPNVDRNTPQKQHSLHCSYC